MVSGVSVSDESTMSELAPGLWTCGSRGRTSQWEHMAEQATPLLWQEVKKKEAEEGRGHGPHISSKGTPPRPKRRHLPGMHGLRETFKIQTIARPRILFLFCILLCFLIKKERIEFICICFLPLTCSISFTSPKQVENSTVLQGVSDFFGWAQDFSKTLCQVY
jgi:hypothetical protein